MIQTFKIVLITYVLLCLLVYFFQEKILFHPERIDKNYRFRFEQPHKEITIAAKDGTLLSGLLFTAGSSKGLIFYLHGNAGSLRTWGEVAETYTALNYDVFMLDYRGYGKSGGRIGSERQIFEDIQVAYDTMKKKYPEDKITVLGYSIGTGPASKLASDNKPKQLILQAPYYSLTSMMKTTLPFCLLFY